MLIAIFLAVLAVGVRARQTVIYLTPATTSGDLASLATSAAALLSAQEAAVAADYSGGQLTLLATTDEGSDSFLTQETLASLASSASSSGFGQVTSGSISPGCGFVGLPYVAGSGESSPGSLQCASTLTFTILTSQSLDEERTVAAFCKALQYSSCAPIGVEVVADGAVVTIATQTPVGTLSSIRGSLQTPSVLTTLRITSMIAYGSPVYVRQELGFKKVGSSLGLCAEKLWYLTFLILLVPLMYVASRFLYRMGAVRGRKKAEAAHEKDRKIQASKMELMHKLDNAVMARFFLEQQQQQTQLQASR